MSTLNRIQCLSFIGLFLLAITPATANNNSRTHSATVKPTPTQPLPDIRCDSPAIKQCRINGKEGVCIPNGRGKVDCLDKTTWAVLK